MSKQSFSKMPNSKRALFTAVLCVMALGVASSVTNKKKEGNIGEPKAIQNQAEIDIEYETPSTPVILPKNSVSNINPSIEQALEPPKEVERPIDKNIASQDKTIIEAKEEPVYEDEYEAVSASNNDFILLWPIAGDIIMDYSIDRLVYDATLDQYRTNDSVSISGEKGASVSASEDGVVKEVSYSSEDGNFVVIDHNNGWQTTYGQLDENLTVKVGEKVRSGQVLGYIGEPSVFGSGLGNHVDFKVTLENYSIDPKTAVGIDDEN